MQRPNAQEMFELMLRWCWALLPKMYTKIEPSLSASHQSYTSSIRRQRKVYDWTGVDEQLWGSPEVSLINCIRDQSQADQHPSNKLRTVRAIPFPFKANWLAQKSLPATTAAFLAEWTCTDRKCLHKPSVILGWQPQSIQESRERHKPVCKRRYCQLFSARTKWRHKQSYEDPSDGYH